MKGRILAALVLMILLSSLSSAAINIIGGTASVTGGGARVAGTVHQFESDQAMSLPYHYVYGILQANAAVPAGSVGWGRASFTTGGNSKTLTSSSYNYELKSDVSGTVVAEARKSSAAGTARSTATIESWAEAYGLAGGGVNYGTIGGVDGGADIWSDVYLDGVGSVASTASGSASYSARAGYTFFNFPLDRLNVVNGNVGGQTSLSGSNNLLGGAVQGIESISTEADSTMDDFRVYTQNNIISDLQSYRWQLGNTQISGSIKGVSPASTATAESHVNKPYYYDGGWTEERNSKADATSEAALSGAVKTYKRDDYGRSIAQLTTDASIPAFWLPTDPYAAATNYLVAWAEVARSNYQSNVNPVVANVNVNSATWSAGLEQHDNPLLPGYFDWIGTISGDVGSVGFGASVAARNPTYFIPNAPQTTWAQVTATEGAVFEDFIDPDLILYSTFDMWLNGPRLTGSGADFSSANAQVLNQHMFFDYQSSFIIPPFWTTGSVDILQQRAVHQLRGNENPAFLPIADIFTVPVIASTGPSFYNAPVLPVPVILRTATEHTDTRVWW